MDTAQKRNFLAGEDAREGFNILTRLRRSGFVHMYTAAPLLMDELGLTESAADRLITQWHRQQEQVHRAAVHPELVAGRPPRILQNLPA